MPENACLGSKLTLVVADDHELHSIDTVEVTQPIAEFSDTIDGSPAEQRFETPLSLMGMARVQDHILVLVLDAVEVLDDVVMSVVECDESDDGPRHLLELRVGLDVLLHRLSHCSRPVVEPLVLPDLVELLEEFVRDVETRPHVSSFDSPLQECGYDDIPDSVLITVIQLLRRDGLTEMLHGEALGLLLGAVALGAVHGIEPGHGWPVAASYALDQRNKWVYGFAASFILGIGHLVSSIAMVAVFFYAKDYFNLTQVNEPITVLGGVQIGGPVSLVAGVLLIALGIREYSHGHSHSHGSGHKHDHENTHDHSHNHSDDHSHDHDYESVGLVSRLKGYLPFVGGHSHGGQAAAADRGLLGIAWFAFLLGFAHEEEFEIIALCAGSNYCLELMSAYAITVIVGIVSLTMLLIAGYHKYEERVEQYTPYLPAFSAAVLVVMGLGFITGLF